MHSVIEFLTAKGYSLALKKYTGSRQGYAGGNRRKESLIKWLEYLRVERSLQNEWVDTTNLYIKFMQARGYLNVMQYERAEYVLRVRQLTVN